MGAHQGEERRQKRTTLRPRAGGDEMRKLGELQCDEAGAQQARDDQPHQHRVAPVALHFQHGEAVGDGGEQQQRGIDRHCRQLQHLCPGRAARVFPAQHAVGGKQAGEDEAVAHQVDPETQQRAVFRMVIIGHMEADRLRGAAAVCQGNR